MTTPKVGRTSENDEEEIARVVTRDLACMQPLAAAERPPAHAQVAVWRLYDERLAVGMAAHILRHRCVRDGHVPRGRG